MKHKPIGALAIKTDSMPNTTQTADRVGAATSAKQTTPALICLCLLALASCQPKQEAASMSDAQLARLSADLYIAEAATNGLAGYERDSLAQVYFKQVLDMHGTTTEQYEKDLRLIVNDLPRMEAILQAAQEHLTNKKKE